MANNRNITAALSQSNGVNDRREIVMLELFLGREEVEMNSVKNAARRMMSCKATTMIALIYSPKMFFRSTWRDLRVR